MSRGRTSGSFTSRLFRKASGGTLAPVAVVAGRATGSRPWRRSTAQRSGARAKLRMVNIGEGRQGEIKVCEGDDPADLAALFCKIHALKSARVLKKIESHITDNLANLPTTPTAAPAAAPAEAK